MENIGKMYLKVGWSQEAKDTLQRVLRIKERHYGPDHFQLAITEDQGLHTTD